MKLWNTYWDQGGVWETILGRNTNFVNVNLWNKATMRSKTWGLWSRNTQNISWYSQEMWARQIFSIYYSQWEGRNYFLLPRALWNTIKWPHPMFPPHGTLKFPPRSFHTLQAFGTSSSPLKSSKSSTSDLTNPYWPLPAHPAVPGTTPPLPRRSELARH